MPVSNEAKRALVTCRVLEDALSKYLNGTMPLHKLAVEVAESTRANGILLTAILKNQRVSQKLMKPEEDDIHHVLRTREEEHTSGEDSDRPNPRGKDSGS